MGKTCLRLLLHPRLCDYPKPSTLSVSSSFQLTDPGCSLPLWAASVPLELTGFLPLATSGSRCYIQHGIENKSRSWRPEGGRPFPLEHGLFFEPALTEPRPGTISCEGQALSTQSPEHRTDLRDCPVGTKPHGLRSPGWG